MTISTSLPSQPHSPFFALAIKMESNKVKINMTSLTQNYYTNQLPATLPVLRNHLPSIFESKCFNDAKLSFEDEVKDTEIGHLFEHICLEYLCQSKVDSGAAEAVYNGETKWDWTIHATGSFEITIDTSFKDIYALKASLQKGVALLNYIFETKKAVIL